MDKTSTVVPARVIAGLTAILLITVFRINVCALTNEVLGSLQVDGASNFGSSVTVVATGGLSPLWVSTSAATPNLSVNNSNYVGIGAAASSVRLSVTSTGTAATDFVQYWRNANNAIVSSMTATGVLSPRPDSCNWNKLPSGTVLFFNLASCPSGWDDMSSTWGGLYIVARPSGGNSGDIVGTALSDTENRPTGQHRHPVTETPHHHTTARYNGAQPVGLSTSSSEMCTTDSATSPANANVSILDSSGSGGTPGTNAPFIKLRLCQKH